MAHDTETAPMFTPVTTASTCDPKGEWFRIRFTSAMGRSKSSSDHFMFRENVQALRDQLTAILAETADGKTLTSQPAIDAAEAREANAQAGSRLAAGNAKETARRAAKRATKAKAEADRDVIDTKTGELVNER